MQSKEVIFSNTHHGHTKKKRYAAKKGQEKNKGQDGRGDIFDASLWYECK